MDAGTAACLMVRKSALDRVGFFDPRYYMFGEDLDLCYRLKIGGWKIFYVPSATASHNLQPPSPERERQISYERHRAMWIYHFKHHSEDSSAFGNGLVWAQIWGRYAASRVRSMIKKPKQQTT
jgi:GT2 family glycosyltransferase